MSPRKETLLHLAIITLACLVVFFVGLTDHGLTNTQESTRLTAALEMQQLEEWILPTRGGEPYIAKPPLMYWIMMGIAEVRGTNVGVFELRATVALGALLGVFAAYWSARVLLRDPDEPGNDKLRREAALWTALGLASGVLYVRSGRIGELDILMIPTVVTAITAIVIAWRTHAEKGKTNWNMVALATLCSAIASLTKGPIPTAVIAVAAYGAIVAEAIFSAPRVGAFKAPARIAAVVAAIAVLVLRVPMIVDLKHAVGVTLFTLVGAALAWGAVWAFEPSRLKRWFFAFSRTHPALVLGAGVASLSWWVWSYRQRADPALLAKLEEYEVDDNLRLFEPLSPVRNLEFLGYGLGPASVACVIALVWLGRERLRLSRGRIVLVCWVLLGLVVFSTMGKGVARYLTNLWPAVSMLGAWWLVSAIRDIPKTPSGMMRWRASAGTIVACVTIGLSWWYADGRDRFFSARSPRDAAIAITQLPGYDASRIGTFGFETPALEYYLGIPTWTGADTHFFDMGKDEGRAWDPADNSDWRARPLAQLPEEIARTNSPYFLLAHEEAEHIIKRYGDLRGYLIEQGITFREVPAEDLPAWRREPDSTPIRLLIIEPAGE